MARFGAVGRAYLAEVPRWILKPILWCDDDHIYVSQRHLRSTFYDAMIFVGAVPLLEVLDRLQDTDVLPVLLRLP